MFKRNLLLVSLLVLSLAFVGCIGPFAKPKADKITVAANKTKVSIADDADKTVKLTAKVVDSKNKTFEVEAKDVKWSIDNKDLASLSAETGLEVTLTAKAEGKVTVTVKYEELDPATIEITITEEEVEGPEDPGGEDPVEDANLILFEDFKGEGDFFSAAYKSLPGDDNAPMYYKTGGTVEVTDEGLKLVGGRFTIGMIAKYQESDPDKLVETPSDDIVGTLDLSKDYRITIKLVDYTPGHGKLKDDKPQWGNFQVYLDNNTTSSGKSIHGNDSRIHQSSNEEDGATAKIIQDKDGILVLEPILGIKTSFLQIRTDADSTTVIESIKIEYIEE